MSVTTVFILSDLCLYRDGLAEVLASTGVIDVIGTGADMLASVQRITQLGPQIVLIDATIKGCFDFVPAIREAVPDAEVVALAVPDAEPEIVRCAEAGLSGYVTRTASLEELIDTLEGVRHGEIACSPRMTRALFRRVGALAAERVPAGERAEPLTRRESEIVNLLEEGLSNKQIAQRLFIEVATVKNHLHNIFEKLHVHRRVDAVARVKARRRSDRSRASAF